MFSLRNFLVTMVFLSLVAVAACPNAAGAGYPDDLEALLPADAQFVAAVTSLGELERELNSFVPEGEDPLDLAALIDEAAPGLSAHVDDSRPLAMVVTVSSAVMMDVPPAVTWIVPVVDDGLDTSTLPADVTLVTAKWGTYQAVSTDPTYEPGAAITPLARGMAPGLLSLSIDLEAMSEIAQPMVPVFLGMAAMRAPAPEGQDEGPEPAISNEQVSCLTELSDIVMASLRRLDLAFDLDADMIAVRGSWGMVPGSALAPTAQPDFDAALALSGLLPADASVVEVLAVDCTPQVDFYASLVELGMMEDAGYDLEAQETFAALLDTYRKVLAASATPMAASVSIRDDAMVCTWAMQDDEVGEIAELWTTMMEQYGSLDMGFEVQPLAETKIDGHAVRRWACAFDPLKLAANEGRHTPDPEELAALQQMMTSIFPGYQMCVIDDVALSTSLGADDDLAAMIAGLDRHAAPHALAARVAAGAGDDCQLVYAGDISAIFGWIMTLVGTMEPDAELPAITGELPVEGFLTVSGADYGFEGSAGRDELMTFIEMLAELEDLEKTSCGP